VLKAYLDETGVDGDAPYCVITGYVGDKLEWEKVDRDWKYVLEEFKVPYFHALEFYGEDEKYENWKEGKRSAFIKALFDCTKNHGVWLVSCAVDSREFRGLTEDERRMVTGGVHNGMKWKSHGAPTKPYFVPLQECIIQAASHVPDNDKVWPVMSRHEKYKAKALEIYNMMLDAVPPMKCRPKLGDEMLFSDPKTCHPLQAADLAAYWTGKAMRYRARTGTKSLAQFPNRVEIKQVFARMRSWNDLKLFDWQGLLTVLQFCNRYIKTSFPTRDQRWPSLPVEERKRVLSVMRKADLRKFLDQWQSTAQERHGRNESVLGGHSEPSLLRWIERLSPPKSLSASKANTADP
jgi:hypothetical protein